MELDRAVPYAGALLAVLLAAVLAGPYFAIEGQSQLLGAYYGSGPLGVVGAIFLAILGSVIFLSGVRGRADPALVAGIMLAVGVTILALTALWAFTIDPTVLFGFPATYSWLELHRWVSLVIGVSLAAAAAAYAAVVL